MSIRIPSKVQYLRKTIQVLVFDVLFKLSPVSGV